MGIQVLFVYTKIPGDIFITDIMYLKKYLMDEVSIVF
jgi:hypothetical protein